MKDATSQDGPNTRRPVTKKVSPSVEEDYHHLDRALEMAAKDDLDKFKLESTTSTSVNILLPSGAKASSGLTTRHCWSGMVDNAHGWIVSRMNENLMQMWLIHHTVHPNHD